MKKQTKKISSSIAPPNSRWRKWGIVFLTTQEDKQYFMENLSMLLSSGIDILSALDAIKDGVKTGYMKKIIDHIKLDMDNGIPIWKALDQTKLFSSHIIALFRIGEESGRLPQNLKIIHLQQQKERNFKSRLRSAMLYPVLVLGLTVCVGLGIGWFILPRLSVVFDQLNLDLPVVTRFLMSIGDFLKVHGSWIVPGTIASLGIMLYFIFVFPKTRFIGQGILFRLPLIKPLIQEVELARFGSIFGSLLQAGIPIIESLKSLGSVTTFQRYQKFYQYIQEGVNEGDSFQKIFKGLPSSTEYIPLSIQQMITSGEKSGNLPDILLEIGDIFEEKTENSTKNLTVILEPLLLIIVWGGVISVALSVILPIYNLVGNINNATTTSTSTTSPAPIPKTISPPPIQERNIPEEIIIIPPVSEETTIPEKSVSKLIILPTGTGSLNARAEPYGNIIATVSPGETYPYITESEGWYEIQISENQTGWVIGRYIELLENDETE